MKSSTIVASPVGQRRAGQVDEPQAPARIENIDMGVELCDAVHTCAERAALAGPDPGLRRAPLGEGVLIGERVPHRLHVGGDVHAVRIPSGSLGHGARL